MSEARHSKQTTLEGIHIIHAFEYVDTTARDAATYTAADVGKAARVGASAPFDFYVLTNATGPAWVQVGAGGGGGGQTDTVVGSSGITNVGTNVDADLAPTYGTTASTVCEGNDARLSDARTPTAHAASHQDGGSDEIATATPAAAAIPKADGSGTLDSWISAASETVAGIMETATAAEVNTGTDAGRAVSPSSLAGSTLASDVAANNAKVTNATHTGEVTGATALTIAANAVTNAKLADVATGTFKGRVTAATGDPEDLTGTQATTLLDEFTSALQGVVPGSGGGTANFLRADGTWAAPPGGGGGITGPGSSVDRGRVVWDGTGGTAVDDTGLRDYGASATDPVSPAPADGDTYRNTALDMQMYYDGTRAKWLSNSTAEIAFGRAGNVGAGAYYRGSDRRSYSATNGRDAENDGTVVAISYTRDDSDAATFEITADGSAIATLASSATSGSDTTLDGDFVAGQVLGARNQSGGNTTSQVMGWATIRWRA